MTGEVRGTIQKVDEDKRLVFGWAYVARQDGEQVVDHSGDVVVEFAKDFEDAAYSYVLESREGDSMHEGPAIAQIVESVVLTPEKLEKMGLSGDVSGWWVGMRINDDDVWAEVKKGSLTMFSIAGTGAREAIEA